MVKLRPLLFVYLAIAGLAAEANARIRTVTTLHTDVSLWASPDRSHGRTERVERREEVQVLRQKRNSAGDIWYQVEIRRFETGKKLVVRGWVDAKYFVDIDQSNDDQDTEAADAAEACRKNNPNCPFRSNTRRQASAIRDAALRTPSNSKGFIQPVAGTMRSGFRMRRHPTLGYTKMHWGVDWAGNNGKAVRASKGGRVQVRSGCRRGNRSCNGRAGNFIVIDHGDGTQTRYLHLNESCRLPRNGTYVSQGQTIGCVGATGDVTGPHLHFEILKNGRPVDPLRALRSGR